MHMAAADDMADDAPGSLLGETEVERLEIEARRLEVFPAVKARHDAAKGAPVLAARHAMTAADRGVPRLADLSNKEACRRMLADWRARKRAALGGGAMSDTNTGADPMEVAERNGTALGHCPDCGRPFGKIRRCWACKPGRVKGDGKGTGPRPPAPVAAPTLRALIRGDDGADEPKATPEPPRPSVRPTAATPAPLPPPVPITSTDILAEAEAIAGVARLLADLDPLAAGRVARWAAERFAG